MNDFILNFKNKTNTVSNNQIKKKKKKYFLSGVKFATNIFL